MPGIKQNGKWDMRPHRERLIQVDESLLARWRDLAGPSSIPVDHAPLLYPVRLRPSLHMPAGWAEMVQELASASMRPRQRKMALSSGNQKGRKVWEKSFSRALILG
jgi:hypothetical protein